MENNKTVRYLKYAIGEIILVVLGILIALQINNWNEQRKLKTQYISDLKTIKENLEKDARTIARNLKNGNRNAKEFKAYFNADSLVINGSSIIIKIGQPALFFDDSGYKTAKSKNTLNLIQNDSLKNLFHDYYFRQIGLVNLYANQLEQLGKELKRYYLESGHQTEGVLKKDIMKKLMQQGPFLDYLEMYNNQRELTLEWLKMMEEFNSNLTKTIDIELGQIE